MSKTFHEYCEASWLYYPTLYHRQEQILDHLFLCNGTGIDWENGELVYYRGEDVDKSETSYADAAGKYINEGEENEPDVDEKKSYWFDMCVSEYDKRRSHKVWGHTYPASKGYCRLDDIPDNINEDWAKAVLLCCDWLDALTFDIYWESEEDHLCRSFLNSREDEKKGDQEKRLKEQYGESTPRPERWKKELERVHNKAKAHAEKQYAITQEINKAAREKINSLYPGLEAYEITIYHRSTEKPEWYIEKEDREDQSDYSDFPKWSESNHFKMTDKEYEDYTKRIDEMMARVFGDKI